METVAAILLVTWLVVQMCMSEAGCPRGMFTISRSNMCFKRSNVQMEWSEASNHCAREGLAFARPSDYIAIPLRNYMLDTNQGGYIWVSARGNSKFQAWVPEGSAVNRNLLWPGAENEFTRNRCLALYAFDDGVARNPGRPYTTYWCNDTRRVLCEGCPEGFFRLPTSNQNQCFKRINEQMPWPQAAARCAREGLRIARPSDDIAPQLRKYLLDTYGGSHYIWVGGGGDGRNQAWQWDGASVNPNLMWPGAASEVSTNRCLSMAVWQDTYEKHPNRPYTTYFCTDPRVVLCQLSRLF